MKTASSLKIDLTKKKIYIINTLGFAVGYQIKPIKLSPFFSLETAETKYFNHLLIIFITTLFSSFIINVNINKYEPIIAHYYYWFMDSFLYISYDIIFVSMKTYILCFVFHFFVGNNK